MGHSEPTSGIAGIMKAVLAIEHGIIPPTVGLEKVNPNSMSPFKDYVSTVLEVEVSIQH